MKNMKRYLALLLTTAVMLGTLTACGGSGATPETTAAPATTAAAEQADAAGGEEQASGNGSHVVTEPVTLTLASQGSGTSNYVTIATYASLFEKNLPAGSKITQETISTGVASAGYLIMAGLCDVAGGQNAISATVGLDGREPITGVSALYSTYNSVFSAQILTDRFIKRSGLSSLEEVVENKYAAHIVAEEVGSSDYVLLQLVLEALGTTIEEMEGWGCTFNFAGGSACSDMLQDGQADLMVAHTTATSSSITELCLSADVSVFSFRDDVIDYLIGKGFQEVTIPADTYNCTQVSSDMDFDLAYTLTKIIVENKDYLAEQLGSGWAKAQYKDLVRKDAMVVPWHPGAMQYFIDIGVVDEDGNYIGEPEM